MAAQTNQGNEWLVGQVSGQIVAQSTLNHQRTTSHFPNAHLPGSNHLCHLLQTENILQLKAYGLSGISIKNFKLFRELRKEVTKEGKQIREGQRKEKREGRGKKEGRSKEDHVVKYFKNCSVQKGINMQAGTAILGGPTCRVGPWLLSQNLDFRDVLTILRTDGVGLLYLDYLCRAPGLCWASAFLWGIWNIGECSMEGTHCTGLQ